MSKKEYYFTTGLSSTIAYQLQRYDHIREDEKFFRDMKVDILLQCRDLLNNEVFHRIEKERNL